MTADILAPCMVVGNVTSVRAGIDSIFFFLHPFTIAISTSSSCFSTAIRNQSTESADGNDF